MDFNIEQWRIVQFRQMLAHNLQEQGGKLRPFVSSNTGYTGKSVSPVNYLGATKARKVTERFRENPMMTMTHTRRWVNPVTYDWGTPVDEIDKLSTGISPEGEYMRAGLEALRRAEDEEVLAAFFGTAKTGESGETTETWSDTGLLVNKDVGGANSGLNHEKLKKLRSIFTKLHVDLDAESPVILITEEEELSLFGENATTSLDFVEGRPVSTGRLPPLYGFRFVRFSSATIDAVPGFKSGSVRSLPVWVPSGMHLGVWRDVGGNVWPLSERMQIPYVGAWMQCGATRLEKGRVLKVQVQN